MKQMQRIILGALSVLAVAGALGSARPAQADASAVAFLKPYVDRARAKSYGEGTYRLRVSIVTNQPDLLVTYLEDRDTIYSGLNGVGVHLTFSDTISFWGLYIPAAYKGTAAHFFNSRRYYAPAQPIYIITRPFDPEATDSVDVTLNVERGTLALKLNSAGGVTWTADLTVFNGILMGALKRNSTDTNTGTVLVSVKEKFTPLGH